MEEKNELNDIILNKGGNGSGSKKLLLAIAALTLILIIVLVIMSSLKNDEVQKSPQAILPPEPSAPTEVINDPLFEPVEVLQEGNGSMGEQTLDQVAQKIKEESLQNAPAAPAPTVTPTKTAIQPSPIVAQSAPAPVILAPVTAAPITPKKIAPATPQTTIAQPTIAKKPESKKVQAAPIAPEPKKVAQSKPAVPAKTAPASTPKPVEPKTEAPVTANNTGATYLIQVGSFSKEPDKALIERLNASGLKYTSQKTGDTTKILVGPFQGEKATQDAMITIRKNIEAKAFKIKG
jgi:DedD protein